jgi:hypothetical protein
VGIGIYTQALSLLYINENKGFDEVLSRAFAKGKDTHCVVLPTYS